MFAFLRRLFRPRQFAAWSVDEARGGYLVGDLFVARSDVRFVVAYKRDLVTTDQLCVGLAYGEPNQEQESAALHVEEDNPSYKVVLADLERHFDLREGWWCEVTQDAFATDHVLIWQRPGDAGCAVDGAARASSARRVELDNEGQ